MGGSVAGHATFSSMGVSSSAIVDCSVLSSITTRRRRQRFVAGREAFAGRSTTSSCRAIIIVGVPSAMGSEGLIRSTSAESVPSPKIAILGGRASGVLMVLVTVPIITLDPPVARGDEIDEIAYGQNLGIWSRLNAACPSTYPRFGTYKVASIRTRAEHEREGGPSLAIRVPFIRTQRYARTTLGFASYYLRRLIIVGRVPKGSSHRLP